MGSTSILGCAYVIANVVPMFSDLVSVTGAFLSSALGFVFPAMLYLGLYWRTPAVLESRMSRCAQNLTAVFSYICLAAGMYLVVVGTFSSLSVLMHDARSGGKAPFSC